jgi:hypothetical protein
VLGIDGLTQVIEYNGRMEFYSKFSLDEKIDKDLKPIHISKYKFTTNFLLKKR